MKKYIGEFWLRGEENKTFPGEIEFGKKRSELSLIIPGSNKPDRGEFLKSDPLRPVLGMTTCGKRITLTDYLQVSFPHSFTQPRSARFCINAAFIGLPFEVAECDPEVETATVTSKSLAEWCGKSAIEQDRDEMWAAKYSPPDPEVIYKGADYAITLASRARTESTRTSASITDKTSIELEAGRPLAWSRAFAALSSIMDAVSIGCGSYCRISHSYAASTDPLYIADYHFHSLFQGHKIPPSAQWLFALRDLPNSAFTKWMENAEGLSRARAMFFSAKHHKMFVETRASLLTQAVEFYYRRVRRPRKDKFKLRSALEDLCGEYHEPISLVFSDLESRVEEVVSYRNGNTHFPLKMTADAMTSGDKLAIEIFLRLLLETCFMSQLDVSIADMTEIVGRSDYYRQLGKIYAS